MKKLSKISIVVLSILILLVCCFLSWSYGVRKGLQAGGMTASFAEFILAEQHMSDQIENANCEGAKQSIQDYLYLIEKYKDVEGSFISDTVYYGDKMRAHLRLSRIEAHMGNEEAATKHMERAREVCTYRKWEDCSDENLISFEERLEEMSPIGCLAHDKKKTAQHANSADR